MANAGALVAAVTAPARAVRRWLTAGLARRMGAAAVLVTVAVIVLAGIGSYAVTWTLLRRNEAQRLDADATIGAQRLAQVIGEELRGLADLARNPLLSTALLDSNGREQYAEPVLRTHAAHRGVIGLALLDYAGQLVTSAGNAPATSIAGAPWLSELVEEGRARAELAPDAPGRLRVMLPVDDPDTVGAEGVLVAELDLAACVARATAGLPRELSLRITAPGGRVVAASGPPVGRASRSWALAVPAPAATLGLRFEAAEPEALVRPPGWIAAVYVLACAALVGLAFVLARSAAERVTRPLRELEAAAARIAAEGGFRLRVPEDGRDEVARLGGAFNRMLAALEEATEADRAVLRARQLRAESALRVALLAVENASDATIVLDPRGRVLFANAAAGRLVGRDAADLLERAAWELHPAFRETEWEARWLQLRAGRHWVGEHVVPAVAPGVAPRHLEVTARHLEADGAEYCVAVLRDVTEHHQAESALRLAGVGTLAAGVAHEINNPLTYVLGNVGFVRSTLEDLRGAAAAQGAEAAADVAEALQALEEARQGAERVREIVRALRTFSRPADRTREVVDLRAAVDSAALLAGNEIRHRARLVVDARPVPRIVANRQRIEQVLVNLLVNAAQAIPDGRADANVITVRIRPSGHGAVVEVEDTGTGMSPEVRARIFEPFFTTKPFGTGTGLGLSICHGIVAELGGRIEVESEAGRGSTFRVVLPAGGDPTAKPPRDAAAPLPPARVLVVDDEPEVGRAIGRLLPAHVEAVAEASPVAALDRLRRGEAFDAVLCDVMMPAMSGFDLAAEVAAARPDLSSRIVFVTGGAFTPSASASLARSPHPCLEKPVAPEALERVLGEVLVSRSRAGR